MEKPIKANAMLEDFNKQNPRTQGKPKEIKTRGQVTKENTYLKIKGKQFKTKIH